MRFPGILPLILLLVMPFMVGSMAAASDPVGGPSLGYSPNADGSIVWPILGIPGASILGHALTLGTAIRGAVVSPRQDYILAIRTEDGLPVISRLTSEPGGTIAIDGARRDESVIAISPAGSAAAFYNNETRVLQLFQGFPAAPALVFESDLSAIAGQITALAVSDDASVALMAFATGGNDSIWGITVAGPQIVSTGRASSIAFVVNSHDAVVADNMAGEALLLQQVTGTPLRYPLFSAGDGVAGLAGIAVSDDGRFIVVAGAGSGNVGIVDMQQSLRSVIPCNCRPSGVSRMTGTAVFRLNQPPDGLVTLLDLSSGKPRILIVPPAPNPR